MLLVTFSTMLLAGQPFRTFQDLLCLVRGSRKSSALKPCGLIFRTLPFGAQKPCNKKVKTLKNPNLDEKLQLSTQLLPVLWVAPWTCSPQILDIQSQRQDIPSEKPSAELRQPSEGWGKKQTAFSLFVCLLLIYKLPTWILIVFYI